MPQRHHHGVSDGRRNPATGPRPPARRTRPVRRAARLATSAVPGLHTPPSAYGSGAATRFRSAVRKWRLWCARTGGGLMHGRGGIGPRRMMWFFTIAAIIAALGVAVPQAGAAPTTIKAAPKAIRFGPKVGGTASFASVEIPNASAGPLQFLVEGGLPDDFGFGLLPGSTCPALT